MSGIIFDLDGTLIDSAPDIHAGVNAMLASEGLPGLSLEQVTGFIGKGVPALIAQVLDAQGLPQDPDRVARMTETFHGLYETAVALTTMYPGADATLRQLHADGFRLGLCTNKPEAPTRAVLTHFGILDLFDAICCGDSGLPRKPDPAPVRHLVDQIDARHFLYVGDSETDAETAQNAKLPIALFTQGYRKTPVAQLYHDAEFDDFADLRAIIDRLVPLPQ